MQSGEGTGAWGGAIQLGLGRKAPGVDERREVGRRCWGCGGIRHPPCAEGRLEKGRGRAGVGQSAVYRAGQGGALVGGEGGSEELLGATRVAKETSRGPRRRRTAKGVRRGGWGEQTEVGGREGGARGAGGRGAALGARLGERGGPGRGKRRPGHRGAGAAAGPGRAGRGRGAPVPVATSGSAWAAAAASLCCQPPAGPRCRGSAQPDGAAGSCARGRPLRAPWGRPRGCCAQ